MKKRVVALGFFDGVHIGHGALLEMTVRRAREKGASAAVMTYSNHPSSIVASSAVKLINTTEERCALMRELYGISDIIVKEFTKEYSSLSGEAFVNEVIKKELAACHVVAGFDFRFGKGGKCDAASLLRLCEENGIGCDIVDEVKLYGEAVSSSRIREYIVAGDMVTARELLGHYHCVIGEVTRGAQLGKDLGFPTANQEIQKDVLCVKHGVYLSRVTVDGKMYRGVTNIGVRPTVSSGKCPRAETFIIDFSGDLYGRKIKLELVKFMRGEEKFSSIETLRERIEKDVMQAKTDF
ncbi:MAG: bifunctional riboflavin kinase/FAD synthetase [Oscillospiraceae bacterium]|nr:bifunctional riboflavin kinase/FAD synthetase [Oscillospiraceae bacterium]